MADEDEAPQNSSSPTEAEPRTISSSPPEEQKLEPPPKPKGRRVRSITSPQTPVARSSAPLDVEESAALDGGLKAPRAPSFTLPSEPLAPDEIDVELDLSPEALHTEPKPATSEAPRPLPPPLRSGPPLRPLSARPISVMPPRPPSARGASDRPRAVSDPPRVISEPQRAASEPERVVSEPQRAASAERVISEPQRAASEPERVVSEPQRAVSEPPRPSSKPAGVGSNPSEVVAAEPIAVEVVAAEPIAVEVVAAEPIAVEVVAAEPSPPRDSEPPASEPPEIPVVDAALEPAAAPSVASAPAPETSETGLARRARMITIPDDQVPLRQPAGEVRSAISAMRIINVGDAADDDIPLEVVTEEPASEPAPDEAGEARKELDSAEELSDEDVAPDPEEAVKTSGTLRTPSGKPPPPPKRPLPPIRERQPTLTGISSEPKRRPWWEEVFGEDYVRAAARLADRQIVSEVNFIEESLGVAPGGVVLDLGCGSGHHAVELASRGYGVVGYDLSLYQLALAADVAQEKNQKLNFLQGDMREMAFEEMFDGVYCWNTTFGYFEEEKNIMVAQRIFRALRPGGMFLLDVANRDFAAVQQPSQVWYEGEACVCMDDMSVDFITSRLRVKRTIILDDGRSRECIYSVRLYALHELGKILHDVGFRIAAASGHPATPGVFFGTSSPRIIILAQRP